MHTLCALLVLYGLFKEVNVARLPVGHTHIDIDGRHAIFSMHFNGRRTTAGHVHEGILTPKEFEHEIKVPFLKDKVSVIKKYGLLAFAEAVNGWLAISNYGTPSKSSRHADKQGCRDPEPHYMQYVKDLGHGDARMRYKFRESMEEWMPSVNKEAVILFHPSKLQAALDLLSQDIAVKELEEWPMKDSIRSHIMANKALTVVQKAEWEQWFDDCPNSALEVSDVDKFEWCVPKLLKERRFYRKEVELQVSVPVPNIVSPLDLPYRHEVIVHTGYTKKDLNRDRRQNEDWNSRRILAQSEEQMFESVKQRRKRTKRWEILDVGYFFTIYRMTSCCLFDTRSLAEDSESNDEQDEEIMDANQKRFDVLVQQ